MMLSDIMKEREESARRQRMIYLTAMREIYSGLCVKDVAINEARALLAIAEELRDGDAVVRLKAAQK
jgi:hypothetical protein